MRRNCSSFSFSKMRLKERSVLVTKRNLAIVLQSQQASVSLTRSWYLAKISETDIYRQHLHTHIDSTLIIVTGFYFCNKLGAEETILV